MKAALVLLDAALCALNVGLYVAYHQPFSLAAAIFIAFCALFVIAT